VRALSHASRLNHRDPNCGGPALSGRSSRAKEDRLDEQRSGGGRRLLASAAALDLPLSLHTATRRQGRIRGAGDKTLRDASSRATKAFYPALSLCDLIFSGVFEREPRLTLAIVEFELAWAPHLLSTMDYTYRERHGEAIYRFKSLPSRRRGACPRGGGGRHAPEQFLPPQRRLKLPGGRHRHSPARRHRRRQHDVGLGLSAQRIDIFLIAQDPAEILAGVPEDEQAKPAPDHDPGIAGGNTARVYNFDVARLTVPA
jgi:hypothetical protein